MERARFLGARWPGRCSGECLADRLVARGDAMSFRKKLLVLFAATVLLRVAGISGSVYNTLRRSFEQAYQDRANAVAAQFRAEFQRRGSEVVRKVESVAASETVQHVALDMNRGANDSSDFVSEARTL